MGQQVPSSVTGIRDLMSGDQTRRRQPEGTECALLTIGKYRRFTDNLIALCPMPPDRGSDRDRLLGKD